VSQKVHRERWGGGEKTLTQAMAQRGGGGRRPAQRMATRGRAAFMVAYGEEKAREARSVPGFLEE
jgi:hypothetical protein